MSATEEPISTITSRVPTREQFEQLQTAVNEQARLINALNSRISALVKVSQASHPLACKITEVVAVGKYKVDVYLPPYKDSSTSALAIADLGTRINKSILWNISELSGGSALAVDNWVDASVAGFDPSGLPLMKTASAGGGAIGVKSIAASSNSGGCNKISCKTWDGTTLGSTAFDVQVAIPTASGLAFNASRASWTSSGASYIESVGGTTGSETQIGDTPASTDGSETAQSTTADSGTTNQATKIGDSERVVYNDAGDAKIYDFRRMKYINSRGLGPWRIDAETRVLVDTPEACSNTTP